MFKPFSHKFVLLALALLNAAEARLLSAAEIRLKSDCRAAGSLLVLGDVADIFSNDAQEAATLAALPLTPAPAPGVKRFLRIREIQDMLATRGVNLAEQRFSGTIQVSVEAPPATLKQTTIQPQLAKPAKTNVPPQQLVSHALRDYLHVVSNTEQDWQLDFHLSAADQHLLRQATSDLRVSGGQAPWSGTQSFTILIPTAEGPQQLSLTAQVHAQRAVVAVIRSLPRGSIVRAADVQLVEPASHEHVVRAGETFHNIEDVVGKETQRSISPGQVLDANYVRSPILIRRGEVVTVYARAAGIRVRTTGRALADGSEGELILVETLETGKREKFDARVTGAQVVEVWAGSIAAGR